MAANSKIGASAIFSKIVFLLKKFIFKPLYNILKFTLFGESVRFCCWPFDLSQKMQGLACNYWMVLLEAQADACAR